MNLIAELSSIANIVSRREPPLVEKPAELDFTAWVVRQKYLADRTDAIIKMENLGVGQKTIHDYLDKSKF